MTGPAGRGSTKSQIVRIQQLASWLTGLSLPFSTGRVPHGPWGTHLPARAVADACSGGGTATPCSGGGGRGAFYGLRSPAQARGAVSQGSEARGPVLLTAVSKKA